MGYIKDKDRPAVQQALDSMPSDVTLNFFTQETECDFCRETHELLEELSGFQAKLRLQVYDFKNDKTAVEKYGIDKIPAIAVTNGSDFGIRFYGIPAGYEFSSLIETILMVSKGESGLLPESRKLLQEITKPVHLQVFVTPT